jgi:GntR family transcriptional regulator/MocR family aminotransferase
LVGKPPYGRPFNLRYEVPCCDRGPAIESTDRAARSACRYPLDIQRIKRDLVDARIERLRSRCAGRPILGHQGIEEALLDGDVFDKPHACEDDHAGIGYRRIAFEAAVVEDAAGFVDHEADPGLVLDIRSQMASGLGAVQINGALHPDIEHRRAIGRDADRRAATPLFQQVYGGLASAILARRLHAGARLPASRSLAQQLGLSRTAVVAAYDQLLAEGYTISRTGSGTYVASDLPIKPDGHVSRAATSDRGARYGAPRLPGKLDVTQQSDDRPFNLGRTLIDARTVDQWRRLTARSLRAMPHSHLGYGDPRGSAPLRRALAAYLAETRAVRCDAEQIIVTGGTQQTIDLIVRALLPAGSEAWIEDPGYPLTREALTSAGVRVRPVRVDGHGLDVAAGIAAAPKARAVFVTPSHQFPTGVVLGMARRLELIAWARASSAWIVEDDYASEFRYGGRPLAALQGLDGAQRTIYVGTLNKALFPGLRVGYLVAPEAVLPRLVTARYLMDRQPPALQQDVLAAFIAEGHLASHVRRIRLLYRDQRDRLVEALRHHGSAYLEVEPPDQGMHLVAHLRPGLCDVAVEKAALGEGVVVRALSRLYVRARPRQGLLLGFSGYPASAIAPAARRLAKALRAAAR